MGCVGMGGVCVGGERRREGGREGEGGEEATDGTEPQNSHKQSFFWFRSSFAQNSEKLSRCLSYRHCRDCFNVLQNHTFREYFLPMCLLVVAVPHGIKTRLKQCHLVVLMNTIGTVLSILCISIVTWASAHFDITCFCLLRVSLSETFPCCFRQAPLRIVASERVVSMLHSEGSDVRIVPFRVIWACRLSILHIPVVIFERCNEVD